MRNKRKYCNNWAWVCRITLSINFEINIPLRLIRNLSRINELNLKIDKNYQISKKNLQNLNILNFTNKKMILRIVISLLLQSLHQLKKIKLLI